MIGIRFSPQMNRPEPVPPNINVALEKTLDVDADVLLATDCDGDAFGLGDENGQYVNPLLTFALLTFYLLEVRGKRGWIVKTVSTIAW